MIFRKAIDNSTFDQCEVKTNIGHVGVRLRSIAHFQKKSFQTYGPSTKP
jgi:hypothetical protein